MKSLNLIIILLHSMIIAYCFIGKLPSYAVDTVYQARLFYNGPIYFIISDYDSPYISTLQTKYNVTIVKYDSVLHTDFAICIAEYRQKFVYLEGLKGRENLFIYGFERFFVLYNLMIQKDLSNVFFLELDNLIYDDPLKWEASFSQKEIAFMFDNYERCASGICFIKTQHVLLEFTQHCIKYITETDITKQFMTEMQALETFWKAYEHRVQILPTHWTSEKVPHETHMNYYLYNNTVFDSAGLGIYLGGVDPFHTNGLILTGLRSVWSAIDYTPYQFEWKEDEQGRNIPYVTGELGIIRINNLHIHSKNLLPCLSCSL